MKISIIKNLETPNEVSNSFSFDNISSIFFTIFDFFFIFNFTKFLFIIILFSFLVTCLKKFFIFLLFIFCSI